MPLYLLEVMTLSPGTDSLSRLSVLRPAQGMKVEPDFANFAPTEELQFLRARVQELEREKAEMAEENRRLKDMLINGGREWTGTGAAHPYEQARGASSQTDTHLGLIERFMKVTLCIICK